MRCTCVLVLFFLVSVATAGEWKSLEGKPAPEPEVESWLLASEGKSLQDLGGRVVLLLLGGAGEKHVPAWNDLRAAYLEDGLRVVAVVTGDAPEGAEYAVAKGTATAYEDGDGARAVLIGADGDVEWEGEPEDLPEDDLPSLLRRTKSPSLEGDALAARVEAWLALAERAALRGDPAEQVFWLGEVRKGASDWPQAADATDLVRSLKAAQAVVEEIRASDNYVRLREKRRRAGDNDRKIASWRKEAERIAGKYEGTVGAARVVRLVEADLEDPAIAAIRAFITEQKIDQSGSSWRTSLPKPPVATFDPKKTYYWVLETNQGRMKLRFFPDVAPMHVTSFIYLTELGFFDGLTFHRVIPGFMAQGGCPVGNGTGAPGYRYDGEFAGSAKHDRPGILSTANSGPGTDGSQFFITFVPYPNLDGKHTVFGVLVEGEDTLKRIEKLGSKPKGATKEKIVIEHAAVVVE